MLTPAQVDLYQENGYLSGLPVADEVQVYPRRGRNAAHPHRPGLGIEMNKKGIERLSHSRSDTL
jgi:hypothetical protein